MPRVTSFWLLILCAHVFVYLNVSYSELLSPKLATLKGTVQIEISL